MQVIKSNTAIVTSGYRDIKCDKLVGGTGKGQHVNGNAVDVIFYDINNKPIDTKYISCIAQDLGFTGIARISDKSIHLDVRTTGKYYGDETKSTNSVTNDFYKYYNIKKENDDIESAIHTLINKGIIADGDYWIEHYSDVKYLKDLIVKFANYIK